MNNKFKACNRALVAIVLGILLFSSCVPMKKQIYLQTSEDTAKAEYLNIKLQDYKLRPGNNLYIQVVSLTQDVSSYFNMGFGTSGNIYYDAAIYLTSYSVNDSGYIEMPFIGKIYVDKLTIEQAKAKIQEQIDIYLKKTMVIVKLVNYNISIVGEVHNPGQYKIYQDRINIYEILAMAGDMTTFAKREDVVLVRKTEKGSKVYHLNLLEDTLLESELFYILPDDIVYIQPVKGKNFAFNQFPYTLVISSISLIIALFALVK
jgi:polysaccharide export outer membrane protein